MTLNILYLAHDLGDPAIWRRTDMLEAGGAAVTVVGFRRGEAAIPRPARVLGHTQNGRMTQRAAAVLRALVRLPGLLRDMPRPDIILARNLEMLALARRALRFWPGPPPVLVYEVLDIHRMMLGRGTPATALRWLERMLARRVDLVLTSSPAFIRNYFVPHRVTAAPVRLVENKFLALRGPPLPETSAPAETEPLVIGWFGILRCAASLACLDRLTRGAPGRYRIVLRGKPALDALPGFHAVVDANPDLVFEGPYRNPDDLQEIYGSLHLAWLIDRYDAGLNSDWLLPNRLYEGCGHGAVPLALKGTETGDLLQARGLGLVTPDLEPATLTALLAGLDAPRLAALRRDVAATDPRNWCVLPEECAELVGAIAAAGVRRRDAAPRATLAGQGGSKAG